MTVDGQGNQAFDSALTEIVAKSLSFDPLIAAVASSELYPVKLVTAASFVGWKLKFTPLAAAAHLACFAALADFRNQRGGMFGRYFRGLKAMLPLKQGVGTPAQRHFAVYHFVVHEIFDGEPNDATMHPFIQALADQLGV